MYEMLYCKKKAHFFAFHNGKFTHPSIIHKKRMKHYGVKYFLEVCFSENQRASGNELRAAIDVSRKQYRPKQLIYVLNNDSLGHRV